MEPSLLSSVTQKPRAATNPNYDDSVAFNTFAQTRVFDTTVEPPALVSFDLPLRNKLAEKNMKLVPFVIDKFYGKVPDMQVVRNDLLQEGYIGLIESLPKFEPDMGYKFSTYATYWIKQQISKFLLRNKTAPGIPSHVRIIYNKLLKEAKSMDIKLKDLVDDEAAMENFGVSVKMTDNVKASMNTRSVVSINDSPGGNVMSSGGRPMSYEDILESEDDSVETVRDNKQLITAVAKALKCLTLRERNILLLRYNVITKPEPNPKTLMGGVSHGLELKVA